MRWLDSEFVESHAQLQGSFDRASTEIAEAVKAIDSLLPQPQRRFFSPRAVSSNLDAVNNSNVSAVAEEVIKNGWTAAVRLC